MDSDRQEQRIPPSRLDALRGSHVVAGLGDTALVALAGIAEERRFPAGELLFGEGAVGHDVMVVLTGRLEARRTTPFGPQRVAELGPGALVGEISLIDGHPRSADVAALIDSLVLRFPGEALAELVASDKDFELRLLRMFCRTLADKIRQANATMTRIMAPDADRGASEPRANGHSAPLDEDATRQLVESQDELRRELAELAHLVQGERFDAGGRIFSEGDTGDRLYVVADGRVRISRDIPGLGEEALTILEVGEVFGEMAWIDARPRSADAIAHVGGCTVLGIGRGDLDETLGASPEIGARFLKLVCQVLCRRVRSMNHQLVAYRTMAWF